MDDQKNEVDDRKNAWARFVGLGIGVLIAIKINLIIRH